MLAVSSACWATASRAATRLRNVNSLTRAATFPAGPVLLAAMMRCPVILFFGLYRGGNRYEIYFEHFADQIDLDRVRRAEDIQFWMQRYAERLEHYSRLAPYNWFNFYPFWD